jgi:hypothetical protein
MKLNVHSYGVLNGFGWIAILADGWALHTNWLFVAGLFALIWSTRLIFKEAKMTDFEEGLNGTTAEDLRPSYMLNFPAPPVGWWVMPGGDKSCTVKFSAGRKPRWLTRKMMDWVFEWKWEDA